MRPSDAVYLAVPLGAAVLVMRAHALRTRATFIVVIAAGLVIGWVEWVVEAYTRYGGLADRLHAAAADNNAGWHFALVEEARALVGPTLCRPGCGHGVVWDATVWWLLAVVLVGVGVWAGRRRFGAPYVVLPTLVALAQLFQYTFLIDYAAPRFLLPVYALLAIPVAEGVAWLATAHAVLGRPAVAVPVLTAVGVAHLAVQIETLENDVLPYQKQSRAQYLAVARDLTHHGIRQPCVVAGYSSPPIAFAAGCNDVPDSEPGLVQKAQDGRTDVAVLTARRAAPTDFFASWPARRVRGHDLRHAWYVYERRQ
jgi:hypothetical protein